ncbi:MAG: serine/threonine-protein kinase [Actinomycetota bacterium]
MSEPLPIDLGISGLGPAVRIGSGGFADVYRAEQVALRRNVAVKVLRAPADDEQARMRFERECHAVGAVSGHPNIVGVHRVGQTDDGRPFLVMEYCPGGSLFDRLRDHGPMPAAEVVDMAIKIGRALGVAHAAGVLHRDVKPANILVNAFGEPALADFGIARIEGGQQTATGMVTASIAHAAPEVIRGETPSHQSDLYSLGSTMFELVVGWAPHVRGGDDTPWALMQRVMNEPVPDPADLGLTDPLASTIRLATRSNPLARFETTDAFVASLSRGAVDVAQVSEETVIPEGELSPPQAPAVGAAPAPPIGDPTAPPTNAAPAPPIDPEPRPATAGSLPAPALMPEPATPAPAPTPEPAAAPAPEPAAAPAAAVPHQPAADPGTDLTVPVGGGADATAVAGPPVGGPAAMAPVGEYTRQAPTITPATTEDHLLPASGGRRSVVPIGVAAAMVAALVLLALVLFVPGLLGGDDSTDPTTATSTPPDGGDTTEPEPTEPTGTTVPGTEPITVAFADAVSGPLVAGATYPVTISGGPTGGTYRLLVDGEEVATGPSPIDFSPPAGRHDLVITADTGNEVSSDVIPFYAVGEPPAAGYRANLLSVTEAPENWSIALARFDQLVAAGHDDVALLSSSDFPTLQAGFWNFFVAGFGDDRGAAQAYCESFGLAIPDDCFVARFDPDA